MLIYPVRLAHPPHPPEGRPNTGALTNFGPDGGPVGDRTRQLHFQPLVCPAAVFKKGIVVARKNSGGDDQVQPAIVIIVTPRCPIEL